jgi:hypothetical protein
MAKRDLFQNSVPYQTSGVIVTDKRSDVEIYPEGECIIFWFSNAAVSKFAYCRVPNSLVDAIPRLDSIRKRDCGLHSQQSPHLPISLEKLAIFEIALNRMWAQITMPSFPNPRSPEIQKMLDWLKTTEGQL